MVLIFAYVFTFYMVFIYPAAGYNMTGNLKVVSDSRIRYIVSKGPNYRFPSHIDLKQMFENNSICIK